jgi:hypothetical protein
VSDRRTGGGRLCDDNPGKSQQGEDKAMYRGIGQDVPDSGEGQETANNLKHSVPRFLR